MESQRYTWGIGIGENERITTEKTLVEELKKIVEGQFE